MHTIIIDGTAVDHAELAQTVELNKNVAETHVALYSDVSYCPDEVYRAWNVAMVLSGEAVSGVASLLEQLIGNAENAGAAAVVYPAFKGLYAANRSFYSSFSDLRYGDEAPLPEDLAARRAALPAAYAKLQADSAAALKLAEAMTEGQTKKEAIFLAVIVDEMVECIADTIKISDNTLIEAEAEAPMALGSEGTMNGATLSGEAEIKLASDCLAGLVKLIG